MCKRSNTLSITVSHIPGYDLSQVNLYLPKLFENLGRLEYENNQSEAAECNFQVTGLVSTLGERLPLKQVSSQTTLLPILQCELKYKRRLRFDSKFLQNRKNSIQH